MNENRIVFDHMPWEEPAVGVKQKVYSDGTNKMRLLKFYDDFIESDWCLKGHVGYVLEGEMTVDFDGVLKKYKKGDGLWIKPGSDSKHKAIIEKGKHIELILFESEQ